MAVTETLFSIETVQRALKGNAMSDEADKADKLTAGEMKPMAVESSYGTKVSSMTSTPGRVAFVMILTLLGLAVWLAPSRQKRTDAEWSPDWDLEAELNAGSPDVVPQKILATKDVFDQIPFHIYLLEKRPRTKAHGDPLAVENVPLSMVVRSRVFDDYALILNKYPLFPGHSLLVTLDQRQQSDRVTRRDLDTLHRCATQAKGIGFYNSHPAAGSSQPHRHFQIVPFSGMTEGIFGQLEVVPPELNWRWSSKAPFIPVVKRLEPFRHFAHGIVHLPPRATFNIDFQSTSFADALLRAYVALAADLGILQWDADEPYNLIVTESWLLMVRRSRAVSLTLNVSANALAFTGPLVVTDPLAFDQLGASVAPLTILGEVAVPALESSSDQILLQQQ